MTGKPILTANSAERTATTTAGSLRKSLEGLPDSANVTLSLEGEEAYRSSAKATLSAPEPQTPPTALKALTEQSTLLEERQKALEKSTKRMKTSALAAIALIALTTTLDIISCSTCAGGPPPKAAPHGQEPAMIIL